MQAVRDAYENTLEKEIQLERVREEFHLLDAEFQRANDKRDETLRQKLEEEVGKAQEELDALKETFRGFEEQKTTWETEDTRLREARAALDDDDTATADQKDEADQAIQDHQTTK